MTVVQLMFPTRVGGAQFIFALSMGCIFGIPFVSLANPVVPDGSTATSVSYDAAGKGLVDIAAPDTSGISTNSYSTFDVTASGLEFENRIHGARTILNQVSGASSSTLGGPIEILGTRANLILANPNGITVDGATFINTGGLALTTGDVSFRAHPISAALGIENVIIDVHNGSGPVVIEGAGLSGAFTFLEVMAREITVDGPLLNDSRDTQSALRLTAGNSRTEFDSLVNPNTTDQVWAEITDPNNESTDEVLVDITQNGTLSGAKITVAVNDRGAGVRHAGVAMAGAGGFSIDISGKVEVIGGQIESDANITINSTDDAIDVTGAASLEAVNDVTLTASGQVGGVPALPGIGGAGTLDIDAASSIIAGNNIAVSANHHLTVDDATLTAGNDLAVSTATVARVAGSTMNAGNELSVTSGDLLAVYNASELTAGGDLTLDAGAALEIIEDSSVSAGGTLTTSAGTDLTLSEADLASAETIVLEAGGTIRGEGHTEVTSTLDVEIDAGRALVVSEQSTVSAGRHLDVTADGRIRIIGSTILAGEDVSLTGESLEVIAVRQRGEWVASTITAADGRLSARIGRGGVQNESSILTGATVDLQTRGDFTSTTLSADAIALIRSTTGELSLEVGGDFLEGAGDGSGVE